MWCPRASIYAFRSYCGGDVVYSGVSGGWFGSPMVVGPGQLGGAPRDHGGAAGHAGSLFRWCLSQVSTAGSLLLGGPFCAAGWGALRAKAMVTAPSGVVIPVGGARLSRSTCCMKGFWVKTLSTCGRASAASLNVASFLKASFRDRVSPCGSAFPLVGEDGLGWKWSGGGGDSSAAVLGGAEGSWLLFGCGSAFVVRW